MRIFSVESVNGCSKEPRARCASRALQRTLEHRCLAWTRARRLCRGRLPKRMRNRCHPGRLKSAARERRRKVRPPQGSVTSRATRHVFIIGYDMRRSLDAFERFHVCCAGNLSNPVDCSTIRRPSTESARSSLRRPALKASPRGSLSFQAVCPAWASDVDTNCPWLE